jgi:hypothetical protein
MAELESLRAECEQWTAASDVKASARDRRMRSRMALRSLVSPHAQLLAHLQTFSARLLQRMHAAEDQARVCVCLRDRRSAGANARASAG